MFRFIKALLIFLQMYKYGFFFSQNTHRSVTRQKVNSHWGFYRFNHKTEASLFDIDFDVRTGEMVGDSYFHIHGSDTRIQLSTTAPVRRTRLLN